MMYLFLTNMQFFTSQDVNWWTGVVWIIVMFLSALILTAPIQCYISPNLFPLRKLILSKIQSLLEQVWFLQLSANELIWISCVNKTDLQNVEKPLKVHPKQPWSHEPNQTQSCQGQRDIPAYWFHARCKDHDSSAGPARTVSRTSCVLGIDWAWRTSERHTRQHCRFSLN